MKKYFILVSVVVGVVFLGAVFLSILQLHRQEKIVLDERVIAGKEVWQREGCMECHAIFGNGGYSGSDLTKIMKRKDEKWLQDFFRDPPIMPPSRGKKHPELTEGEVAALVDFFNWVKEIDTKGWPPRPNFNIDREPSQK